MYPLQTLNVPKSMYLKYQLHAPATSNFFVGNNLLEAICWTAASPPKFLSVNKARNLSLNGLYSKQYKE